MATAMFRQGDVLLVRVAAVPTRGSVEEDLAGRSHVLAEGEATGHAHVLAGPQVRLLRVRPHGSRWGPRPAAETFVRVEGAQALLKHEEHLPITVPPGVYEVRRQREYRPSRPIRVAD